MCRVFIPVKWRHDVWGWFYQPRYAQLTLTVKRAMVGDGWSRADLTVVYFLGIERSFAAL